MATRMGLGGTVPPVTAGGLHNMKDIAAKRGQRTPVGEWELMY